MEKNFFKKIRILDGGMGQALLAKGLKPLKNKEVRRINYQLYNC